MSNSLEYVRWETDAASRFANQSGFSQGISFRAAEGIALLYRALSLMDSEEQKVILAQGLDSFVRGGLKAAADIDGNNKLEWLL